jgi:prepilin-type N-terminal cleavage/methylation domain-containing protein
MKIKKSSSSGFTLIELLIVIIIIGILAAIAFVAYSGSQNKAHKADAQSVLSEAKTKLAEYNADKGVYPSSKGDFITWLKSDAGGNNKNFSQKFSDSGYSYSCTSGSGGSDGSTGGTTTSTCSGYSLTADASLWHGSDNITVTN